MADADRPRYWLLLEKVAGVELWQVGDFAVWEDVARWLGAFHARFFDETRGRHSGLLREDTSKMARTHAAARR